MLSINIFPIKFLNKVHLSIFCHIKSALHYGLAGCVVMLHKQGIFMWLFLNPESPTLHTLHCFYCILIMASRILKNFQE